MESWFYNLINVVFRLVLTLLTDWEVSGVENVPTTGPLIVAANHISFLDGLFLALVIPRHVHLITKVESLNIPILGGFIGLWGAFPVRRGVVDRKALHKALTLLAQGKVLGFFPEGTRGRGATTHKLLRAKPGITVVALRSGAPILPVGFTGTENPFSPRSPWLQLRRPKVHIQIGTPFTLPRHEGQVDREMLYTLTSDIMYRIADLLPPEYHGYYADRNRPLPDDVRGKAKSQMRYLVRDARAMASQA